MIKDAFALFTLLLVWFTQLFSVSLSKSNQSFLKSLTSLPVVSMNFSIIFFFISIFRIKYPQRITKRFQDTLLIIIFSLTTFAVSIHWYIANIDPHLISKDRIQMESPEFYCSLFLNGGNLLLLIWYGLNIDKFSKIYYQAVAMFIVVFFIWYFMVIFATWVAIGDYPYEFIKIFKIEDYVMLAATVGSINVVAVAGMVKFIRFQLSVKKNKKD